MGLISDIGRGPVAIDTAAFIYFIEEHPKFLPVVVPLFEAIDKRRVLAVTSAISLLELLVVPYRLGDVILAERYEALLTRSRGLRLVDLDRPQLKICAQLRATYSRIKTPDALQLVAGLTSECSTLVTNDREIPSIGRLRVLQIRDYVGKAGRPQ